MTPDDKKLVGIVGLFDTPDELVRAAAQIHNAGFRRWDCHTPYPVHALGRAMNLKPSPIGAVCLAAGFFGAAVAMLLQWWTNAIDYPIVIGGKPLFSWPAFVPITFELFVLFAAGATLLALIVFCKLARWHSPLHDSGIMPEITSNRFAVVIDAADSLFSIDCAHTVLEQAGCTDVRPLYEHREHGGWLL